MKFSYKARTQSGEIQTGNVEASSRTTALELLQRHNLVVITLKEEGPRDLLHQDIPFLTTVGARDLVIFSRSLSSLFDAGVPLVESIRVLAEQTQNKYFQRILYEVASDVDGGLSFSRSLSQHPKVFSAFYINMIKTGEVSGNLQRTLLYLADYLEKDYALRSKIRSAMIYPAFVIFVFIVVGIIMLVFVIPKLGQVLKQMAPDKLPAITTALFSVSDFMVQWWWIILLAAAGAIGAVVYYFHTPEGRRVWHGLQLQLPIFGPLLSKIYQTRFADNLSTLIRGGLPIIQSLKITGDVVGNLIYWEIIDAVAEQVKAGTTIESVLKKYPQFFSSLAVQMIAVGEKSGKLESILGKVASFYQGDIDRTVDNLTSLIEPIMIIILGVGVGLTVAAVIIPMYTVVTAVGGS